MKELLIMKLHQFVNVIKYKRDPGIDKKEVENGMPSHLDMYIRAIT